MRFAKQARLCWQTMAIKSCQQTWSWTAVLHQMHYSVFVPLIPSWCIIIEVESLWVLNLPRNNNTKLPKNTGSIILTQCPFDTEDSMLSHKPNSFPHQLDTVGDTYLMTTLRRFPPFSALSSWYPWFHRDESPLRWGHNFGQQCLQVHKYPNTPGSILV